MFLAGLKFGIGFLVGMSGTVAIVMGLVALATWFKRWWASKSEQARQEMAERMEFRKQMVDRAELTIARHEKLLVLLRYPSWIDEETESACR
jgi:hypothetical protein